MPLTITAVRVVGVGIGLLQSTNTLRRRGAVWANGGRMNIRRLIAALAVFAVAATGIGVSIAMITAKDPPAPTASRTPLPTPTPKVPTPAEFQIGIVVTDQNCAGPNGCVYKYRVEPKYLGLHPLPDSRDQGDLPGDRWSSAADRRLHRPGRPGQGVAGCSPRGSARCAVEGGCHEGRGIAP